VAIILSHIDNNSTSLPRSRAVLELAAIAIASSLCRPDFPSVAALSPPHCLQELSKVALFAMTHLSYG
jgi:hypothetical protein